MIMIVWWVVKRGLMGSGLRRGNKVAMAEWLRRQTRNLLGSPAQVRILLATFFTPWYPSDHHPPLSCF